MWAINYHRILVVEAIHYYFDKGYLSDALNQTGAVNTARQQLSS